MRPEQRDVLRRQFDFRCGYCGVTENDVGAELTIDHYRPRSQNGPDEPANWVYSCFACNTHKGDLWAPDSPQRVLHPLHDNIAAHVSELRDGTVAGLTETGRFHVEQLQLNRPPLVAHRLARRRDRELRQALDESLREQEALRRRIVALEQAVAAAERRLSSL